MSHAIRRGCRPAAWNVPTIGAGVHRASEVIAGGPVPSARGCAERRTASSRSDSDRAQRGRGIRGDRRHRPVRRGGDALAQWESRRLGRRTVARRQARASMPMRPQHPGQSQDLAAALTGDAEAVRAHETDTHYGATLPPKNPSPRHDLRATMNSSPGHPASEEMEADRAERTCRFMAARELFAEETAVDATERSGHSTWRWSPVESEDYEQFEEGLPSTRPAKRRRLLIWRRWSWARSSSARAVTDARRRLARRPRPSRLPGL